MIIKTKFAINQAVCFTKDSDNFHGLVVGISANECGITYSIRAGSYRYEVTTNDIRPLAPFENVTDIPEVSDMANTPD